MILGEENEEEWIARTVVSWMEDGRKYILVIWQEEFQIYFVFHRFSILFLQLK